MFSQKKIIKKNHLVEQLNKCKALYGNLSCIGKVFYDKWKLGIQKISFHKNSSDAHFKNEQLFLN